MLVSSVGQQQVIKTKEATKCRVGHLQAVIPPCLGVALVVVFSYSFEFKLIHTPNSPFCFQLSPAPNDAAKATVPAALAAAANPLAPLTWIMVPKVGAIAPIPAGVANPPAIAIKAPPVITAAPIIPPHFRLAHLLLIEFLLYLILAL